MEKAIYKKGETHFIDFVGTKTDAQINELLKENKGSQVMLWEDVKKELDIAIIEKYVKEWKVVVEDRFWDILESVPPYKHGYNYVFCGEFTIDDITLCIIEINDTYYEANRSVKLSIEDMKKEIVKQFNI